MCDTTIATGQGLDFDYGRQRLSDAIAISWHVIYRSAHDAASKLGLQQTT